MPRVTGFFLWFVLLVAPLGARAEAGFAAPADPAQVLQQIRSVRGVLTATLEARTQKVVLGGVTINAMVYNGQYGGPTLRVRPGDLMRIRLVNRLDEPTNLHFHGYRGSPLGSGDNMSTLVEPGRSFEYRVRIPRTQPPGLYWYHAHIHKRADAQIMAGLSGMLVVEGLERQFPQLAGVKHETFGLKQYRFDDSDDPVVNDYFHGVIQTINGGLVAQMSLRPGETGLWSFANEDSDLPIRLSLAGHAFRVIARDGEAGTREIKSDTLTIPPAGRAEVLIDAGASGAYLLTANRLTGDGDQRTSQRTMGVLTVAGPPTRPRPILSRFPRAIDLRGKAVTAVRAFSLTEKALDNHFYINGQMFDHHRVDTRVALGSTEEWVIRNDSDDYHAFHIHQVGFQVVAIDGVAQPFEGYRDTVVVPERGEVKIRLAFTDPLIVGRFMYHCHVLDHEDKGMMGVIEVYDPKAAPGKGAAFKLVDQFGHGFSQAALGAKPTLMFFGYDYCPDFCPLALARLSQILKTLGPAAAGLNVVYVTIDPERDTSAALKDYLSGFDPRIHGLTGSRSAIAKIARELGVSYRKVPMAGGGYSMEHSAEIYVLDGRRALIGHVAVEEPDATLLPRLRRLIAG